MHCELGALALRMQGPELFQLSWALPFNSCVIQEYFACCVKHNQSMKNFDQSLVICQAQF